MAGIFQVHFSEVHIELQFEVPFYEVHIELIFRMYINNENFNYTLRYSMIWYIIWRALSWGLQRYFF